MGSVRKNVIIVSLLSLFIIACGSTTSTGKILPTASPSPTASSPTAISQAIPTATATPRPTSPAACSVFPSDNIWNRNISQLPLDPNSAQYISSIGISGKLHPDFGADSANGIPYNVVANTQTTVNVNFQYADESDKGPYPIPAQPLIEGGAQSTGDRHILMVNMQSCILYELFDTHINNGQWSAGSGAIWDLRSDALRPAGWTSADAAGLPIYPGLVRYDEVAAGVITHALRFTVQNTRNTYVWPARHQASSQSGAALPPMGLRLRLKASFDIAGYPLQDQIILTALKKYGMIVADNGANWFLGGAPDSRWNDDVLHQLTQISGTNFEVVDTASLMINPNSGQSK